MDNKGDEEKNIIINAVVKEASTMWIDYKKRIKDDSLFNDMSPQSRFEYYMKTYIDFTRQWAIITRHISSYGMYNEKAVRLYVNKCITMPYKTDEEYCERQADYVKYLYMYSKNHFPTNKLKEIWTNTKKCLMEELKSSREENEIIKNRRKKNKICNDITRRENIKHIIVNNIKNGC
jgi:hypothetical protein